jgi:non-specific serine/threonine protein kinase
MDPKRHARLQELFFKAIEVRPDEREALFDEACEGDHTFRREVEQLVAAHESPASLLAHHASIDEAVRAALVGDAPEIEDASDVIDPEAIVGTVFDEIFEIDTLLGRGGVGSVFRARHRLLRDVVALKFLSRDLSASAAWRERFLREGRAARRFRHPNAVTVYDLRATRDGTLYLVLEYVDGRTLRAELKTRGCLDSAEALDLVEPIASVLDTAHAAGVIHRDLKPENVMLASAQSGKPIVKVLDLGIARLVDPMMPRRETGNLTFGGMVLGTPLYMSPEQWGVAQQDGIEGVDGRTDVYSLAVMVFEMVCGQPPYHARRADDLRRLHTTAPIPSPADLAPELPERFGAAIVRALAKDRADRFATAGELVEALRAGLGHDAGRESTPGRPRAERSSAGATGEIDPGTGVGAIVTAERPPTNLPAPATSFFGRHRDIEEIEDALGANRLVTLLGPGGIGKTRLAIRVGSNLLDRFADGVWFADLSRLSDPDLLASTVAALFGVAEKPGESSATLLAEALRHKRALIVLDNCEHLRQACASLARGLLRACPGVRVLGTSRKALGVATEYVWEVSPLPLPIAGSDDGRDPLAIRTNDAVRLFVDRARAVRRDFRVTEQNADVIAALCRRLDGIPLALELAAARSGVMTPMQIMARIEKRLDVLASREGDTPDRHRTLRASIEWSFQLLAAPLQRVFASLSVFRGGWALDAAESVLGGAAGGAQDSAGMIDALEQLRECSLVVTEELGDEIRFRLLETIREFAAEQVEAAELQALRAEHARFFRAFAERAEPELTGPNQAEWLGRLDADLENIRAAVAWSLSERSADTALRIAAATGRYWVVRGLVNEGLATVTSALATGEGAAPEMRARALNWAGNLATVSSELERARAFHEEALALRRAIDDKPGIASSLHNLGGIATDLGKLELADRLYEECFEISTVLGDTLRMGQSLVNRGRAASERGLYDLAADLLERGIGLLEQQGHTYGVCIGLLCLGDVAQCTGEADRAEELLERSLALATDIGERVFSAYSRCALGSVARYRGDYARAEEQCGRALSAARELGSEDLEATALAILGETALARGAAPTAGRLLRESLAIRAGRGLRLGVAGCFEGLAAVAVEANAARQAARLLGAAEALRCELGVPVAVVDRATLDATRERVRSALGPAAFDSACEAGRGLALEEAVAEAMAELGRRDGPAR